MLSQISLKPLIKILWDYALLLLITLAVALAAFVYADYGNRAIVWSSLVLIWIAAIYVFQACWRKTVIKGWRSAAVIALTVALGSPLLCITQAFFPEKLERGYLPKQLDRADIPERLRAKREGLLKERMQRRSLATTQEHQEFAVRINATIRNFLTWQFTLLSVAVGCTRAGSTSLTAYALARQVRSRTNFAVAAMSVFGSGALIAMKVIVEEIRSDALADFRVRSKEAIDSALVHFEKITEFGTNAAAKEAMLEIREIPIGVLYSLEPLTSVQFWSLILLTYGVVFLCVDKFGLSGMARSSGNGFRWISFLLSSTACLAVLFTVRRLVFVLTHWPTDIGFVG